MKLVAFLAAAIVSCFAAEPCRIEVVEKGSGWPVPLVELKTTHHVRFVSDNNGLIACDAPELMGRETFFFVNGHGYEHAKDGFGFAGVRLTPEPGKTLRVEVERKNIARRLGRITGAGIFAESQKLGLEKDWKETGVFGCDSVLNAVYKGKMFWAWGDTTLGHYPLGVFDASSATTAVRPLSKFEPPVRIQFEHFRNKEGRVRGVAPIPGSGPTWLWAYVTLKDKDGNERLVASYNKIKPPLEVYEQGLCVWDDAKESFERFKVIWEKEKGPKERPLIPDGQPVFWEDTNGVEWVLFGNPFPAVRCKATYESWADPATWEKLDAQKEMTSADGKKIKVHTGHMMWSEFRKRWVAVFLEIYGKPSMLGEMWYAEAESPFGPWGAAVKIVSHDNYTFYNPRLHPEFADSKEPILIFEATYTSEFADRPFPTARHDYNQILYRLDLDDPRLAPTHAK